MAIDRLPSGKYRVRKMVDKVMYTFILDHKPTDSEVIRLLAEKIADKSPTPETLPLKKACLKYMETKSNLLSPSTVRGYTSIVKQIPADMEDVYVANITKPMLQAEVNRYAADHSPKSAKNYGMFLTTVCAFYGNEIRGIQYPQMVKKESYIPTVEELRAILKDLEGTNFYVPVFLGCRGLRLSEVCALTLEDLSEDNILTIDKAKVRAVEHYETKTTKTVNSARRIAIPARIADIIRAQGYIYTGHPCSIYRKLIRAEERLGIPSFSFHQLRHFFASYAHYEGFVDKAIQDDAGWATDATMKATYRQAMDKDAISRQISASLERIIP